MRLASELQAQETIAVIRSAPASRVGARESGPLESNSEINAFAPVVECSLSLKPNAVPVEERDGAQTVTQRFVCSLL